MLLIIENAFDDTRVLSHAHTQKRVVLVPEYVSSWVIHVIFTYKTSGALKIIVMYLVALNSSFWAPLIFFVQLSC